MAIVEPPDDPEKLRRRIGTARRMNEGEVEKAAFRRLVEILPDEAAGNRGA